MKKVSCLLILFLCCFLSKPLLLQAKVIYENDPTISDLKIYNPDGTLCKERPSRIIVKTGDTIKITCKIKSPVDIAYVACTGNLVYKSMVYDPMSNLYVGEITFSSDMQYGQYFIIRIRIVDINQKDTSIPLDWNIRIIYNSNCSNGDHTIKSTTEAKTIVNPTCTTVGYTAKKCIICETPIDETKMIIPARGHDYQSWKINTSKGTATHKCIRCKETQTEDIDLTATSLTMQTGKTTSSLKASTSIKGDKATAWSSSNSKVVAVDKKTGKLTAKKAGTAKITVKMKSGITATCTVKVQKGDVKAKKISLNKTKLQLKKGKTFHLKVSREPFTVTEKLTFTSSNKKVATVNSKGKITAKKKGTATITVKSGSKKVKCKVTVK